jgi:O-antigen/teichoic acid export membrane protein
MSRYLGTEGYGDYRLIIAFLTVAGVLADLGTPLIIARELARPGADQARVLGNALGLRLAAVLVAITLTGGFAWLVAPAPGIVSGILAGAIGFVAMGQHTVLQSLFRQRLRQTGPVLAETVGALALLVFSLLLSRTQTGVLSFVVATAASSVATIVISGLFARRLLAFRLRFEPAEWRALLVPAAPIAVTILLTLVYYRLDTIMLGIFMPGEEVGLYGVPAKILDAVVGFTMLFSGLLMPLMSRHAGHDQGKFLQAFHLGTDTLVIGTGAILLVFLLYAEEIVVLIGGDAFIAGGPVLRVLGVMAVIVSIRFMAHQAVAALNAQGRLIGGYFAAAVIGVMAYLFLIPRYGGVGAASALLLGELIVFGWTLAVLARRGVAIAAATPLKALVTLSATFALGTRFDDTLPWPIMALSAVGVYLLALVVTRSIPRHVLALLKAADQ